VTPQDVLEAEKAAREQGLEVVGWYHSHPDHPARPSEYDRDHAWPWYSYIIVSVQKRRAPGDDFLALERRSRGIFTRRNRDSPARCSISRWFQHKRRNEMPVKVLIPSPLRPYAGKRDSAEFSARTVGEALGHLTTEFGNCASISSPKTASCAASSTSM